MFFSEKERKEEKKKDNIRRRKYDESDESPHAVGYGSQTELGASAPPLIGQATTGKVTSVRMPHLPCATRGKRKTLERQPRKMKGTHSLSSLGEFRQQI